MEHLIKIYIFSGYSRQSLLDCSRKYRGKISEEIYDELFDEMEKNGQLPQESTLDIHIDREEGDDEGAEGPKGNTDDESEIE